MWITSLLINPRLTTYTNENAETTLYVQTTKTHTGISSNMNMLDEIHKTHIHTSKIVLSFIIESCLDFPIMRKALKHYRSKHYQAFLKHLCLSLIVATLTDLHLNCSCICKCIEQHKVDFRSVAAHRQTITSEEKVKVACNCQTMKSIFEKHMEMHMYGRTAGVRTVAWSLRVLPLFAWALSGYCGFFKQCKDT